MGMCMHRGTRYACRPHAATFAIRPEHMRLHTAPAPDAVPGIVHATTYNGEFTAYRVAIGDVEARVKAYQALPQPAGTPVWVQFPPEHLFEIESDYTEPQNLFDGMRL